MTIEERAAIVAVLLAGGESVACWSAAAQVGLGELLALPGKARERRLAAWRAELLAPLAHAELVHPSWWEDPVDTRGAEPSVARWLEQRARGTLVDMPAAMATADEIEAALVSLGRQRLALALHAVPAAAQAQVLARLGPAEANQLVVALRAPADRGEVSLAVRELGELVARSGPALLFHAGARRLAGALVGEGDLVRQLAQRSTRERGLLLLDEHARALSSPGEKTFPDARATLRTLRG